MSSNSWQSALRAKIGPDKTKAEGCGGSTVEADNECMGQFFAATQRDGADFSDLFVTRRSSRPATVHSSLLDLGKIRSRRCRQEFDDTT